MVGQVVLLGCRRSRERAPGRPAQGCHWGPPGTRQYTWGPEHPYPTQDWGKSLAMTVSSCGHGPQSTPQTANSSGWEDAAELLLCQPPLAFLGCLPSHPLWPYPFSMSCLQLPLSSLSPSR